MRGWGGVRAGSGRGLHPGALQCFPGERAQEIRDEGGGVSTDAPEGISSLGTGCGKPQDRDHRQAGKQAGSTGLPWVKSGFMAYGITENILNTLIVII